MRLIYEISRTGYLQFIRSSLVKEFIQTVYTDCVVKPLVPELNWGLPVFSRALFHLSQPAFANPNQLPRPGSNRRLPACDTGALPTELRDKCLLTFIHLISSATIAHAA